VPGESDEVFRLIHRLDSHAGHGPDLKTDHFDIRKIMPVGTDVAGGENKSIRTFAGGFRRRLRGVGDVVIAIPGQSRPIAPLAIGKKLHERPLTAFHFGEIYGPPAASIFFPPGDALAT
jgi:hypothetical protein